MDHCGTHGMFKLSIKKGLLASMPNSYQFAKLKTKPSKTCHFDHYDGKNREMQSCVMEIIVSY